MVTETERLLERIAEGQERMNKTLEAIEQIMVNEDGQAGTLVRMESLLDNQLNISEDIESAASATAFNTLTRWQRFRIAVATARLEADKPKI